MTIASILARYADGIAFVAEEPPAATISDFADQLRTAAEHLDDAGIQGTEDLEIAATYLADVDSADGAEQGFLLGRAARYLANTTDMVDDYRLML